MAEASRFYHEENMMVVQNIFKEKFKNKWSVQALK